MAFASRSAGGVGGVGGGGRRESDQKGLLDYATDVYSEDRDLIEGFSSSSVYGKPPAGRLQSSHHDTQSIDTLDGDILASLPTQPRRPIISSDTHADRTALGDASLADSRKASSDDTAAQLRMRRSSDPGPDVSLTLQRAKEREVETLEDEQGLGGEISHEKVHYDDFTTIDWMRDHARESQRQRTIRRERLPGWKGKLQGAQDGCQGWTVVFVIGIIAGFIAGIIDVSAEWLSDIKEGVCPEAFYLNHAFCCWASSENNCTSWKKWSDFHSYTDSSAYAVNFIIYVVFAVTFAFLSAVFVKNFATYAAGSGIPQVKTILGGFVIRKFLGFWTLVTKSIGLILSVSSGMSLGKEGPFVHIVCCIGNICTRMFEKYRNNEAKKREVLSAAAAAGVSVAFGAPVGGVLFSLEEVSYYFPHKTMWRSFFCALVAATTLRYMNPFLTGRVSLFYVEYDRPWHMIEMIPFALLGVFGGLFGAIFIKVNARWCAFRKSSKLGKYPILEVVGIAFITASVNYLNPYQRIASGSLIRDLFSECSSDDARDICDENNIGKVIGLLFLAAAFRMVITVFTFGLKIPAGVFIPSMAIGACMGRILGIGMQRLVEANPNMSLVEISCGAKVDECIVPGLYAMVGAAAVLGGVTRMTVSLVVIMFELTGGLSYVLPFMIAVMMSKWVGDALSREGLYDRHIRLNGYPFLDNREEFRHTTLACDVMYPQRGDAPICVLGAFANTVGQLESLLKETDYKGFPVVMSLDSMQIAGYVARSELKLALEKARQHSDDVTESTSCSFTQRVVGAQSSVNSVNLRHILDASPVQVAEHTPTEMVLELFRKLGLRYALVSRNGQLVGIITKKDLLRHMAILNHRDVDSVLYH